MHPIKIKIDNNSTLSIMWNNGEKNEIELRELRKFCPCATCLAEREKQSSKYIPIFSENQITVQSINQVGKYAIQIHWKDGHNTGIYEYPFLRNLPLKKVNN
jgi:DUF971 family protein